ncbi:hypothetical protein P7C70_g1545, partial [Phenoliferia sp. Uapishka_3]
MLSFPSFTNLLPQALSRSSTTPIANSSSTPALLQIGHSAPSSRVDKRLAKPVSLRSLIDLDAQFAPLQQARISLAMNINPSNPERVLRRRASQLGVPRIIVDTSFLIPLTEDHINTLEAVKSLLKIQDGGFLCVPAPKARQSRRKSIEVVPSRAKVASSFTATQGNAELVVKVVEIDFQTLGIRLLKAHEERKAIKIAGILERRT